MYNEGEIMATHEIRNSLADELLHGLNRKGKVRAALFLSNDSQKKDNIIATLGNDLQKGDPSAFWVTIESSKAGSPYEWCSQFARNLRTYEGVKLKDLASFAFATGKSLRRLKEVGDGELLKAENDSQIAIELVNNFESLIDSNPGGKNTHLILIIKDLENYTKPMLDWICGELNQAFRNCTKFAGCRFVFTSTGISDRERSFFDAFGFEVIHATELDSSDVNPKEPEKLLKIQSQDISTQVSEIAIAQNKSPKSLQKNTLPGRFKEVINNGLMDLSDAENFLSSYKNEELSYLFLVSYPTRTSRYTLEHFTSDRDAALAYNWLKRSKSIHSISPFGDLLLNEDLRVAARTIHESKFKEVSEKWRTLAKVLDTFQEHFPVDSTHWIPINLQLFESFNHRMLKQLFAGDELSDVLEFVEQHKDVFIEKGNRLSLSDETKLIIRRYLELSERTCLSGLSDRIREIWLKDQEHYKIQRAKMLEEKESITSEIEGTLKQVASLKELKDNLVQNSRNPNRNKPERIYTFSTSRALIVVGLGTVGASLLSEGVGSYHAACGLALTLFGFFWPNVEIKRPALATVGTGTNLAIETQQRSLNHRVGSLSNRIGVMKGNLDAVELQLSKLGDSPPLPYLDSDTDAETS